MAVSIAIAPGALSTVDTLPVTTNGSGEFVPIDRNWPAPCSRRRKPHGALERLVELVPPSSQGSVVGTVVQVHCRNRSARQSAAPALRNSGQRRSCLAISSTSTAIQVGVPSTSLSPRGAAFQVPRSCVQSMSTPRATPCSPTWLKTTVGTYTLTASIPRPGLTVTSRLVHCRGMPHIRKWCS